MLAVVYSGLRGGYFGPFIDFCTDVTLFRLGNTVPVMEPRAAWSAREAPTMCLLVLLRSVLLLAGVSSVTGFGTQRIISSTERHFGITWNIIRIFRV